MTYLLSFPFEHYLPRIFHLHTRSIVVICLPDWPYTWPLQGLILKFPHRNFSFFSPSLKCFTDCFVVQFISSIKIENLSRVVNQRKAIQSTNALAKTKNLTQAATSPRRFLVNLYSYMYILIRFVCGCKIYMPIENFHEAFESMA